MLLTAEDINALLKSEVKDWIDARNKLNGHLRSGGTLTPKQEQDLDFISQKLDDWRSDYYGQAGL